MVDNHEDTVIFFTFWQVCDEIHRYVLKGAFFDVSVELLKGGLLSRDVGLQLLTVGASLYVLFDKGS